MDWQEATGTMEAISCAWPINLDFLADATVVAADYSRPPGGGLSQAVGGQVKSRRPGGLVNANLPSQWMAQ